MATITQAERDRMAEEGLIDGEKPKLKLAGLKRPQAPEPAQAPVVDPVSATNVVVNHIDDKTIHKILEQNATLIKQMAVQLKSMSINNERPEKVNEPRAATFHVKRDVRGMIESVEVAYRGAE